MNLRPYYSLITNQEMNYFGSTENGKLFFNKVLNK